MLSFCLIVVTKTSNIMLNESGEYLCLIPFFIIFKIYLVLAALGLRCCAQACFHCSKWELLFIVMHGLLIVLVSLVAKHRLQAQGL